MPGVVSGRPRASVAAAVGLVLLLVLTPPLFVFVLPLLAGLLLLSGPRTLQEWCWIGISVIWLAVSAEASRGIVDRTVLAGGLMAAGAFLILVLRWPRPFLDRALAALALAGITLTFWGWWLGIGWQDIQSAVLREGWEMARQVARPAADSASATLSAAQPFAEALAEGVGPMSAVFPSVMALCALAGMAVAWSWYRRIAREPRDAPLGRLAEFRFSDQLVWGMVTGIALLVMPAGDAGQVAGENLVLFFGGLYVVRGLAIARSWSRQAPGLLLGLMALSLLFILPVALGGLLSLGLADTWLDFRRRLAPPPVEG
jgi:hypothetical protein